jgi:hypothetical protein
LLTNECERSQDSPCEEIGAQLDESVGSETATGTTDLCDAGDTSGSGISAAPSCTPRSFASSPEWPAPIVAEGYEGLAGEIIRAIEPHTESDPAALLIQLLVAFGNFVGRNAHFVAEADRHYTNLFTVLVGESSKGRKGSSWGHIKALFQSIESMPALPITRTILNSDSSLPNNPSNVANISVKEMEHGSDESPREGDVG